MKLRLYVIMDVIITVGLRHVILEEWRDVRYLYDYNEQELIDLAQKAQILAQS